MTASKTSFFDEPESFKYRSFVGSWDVFSVFRVFLQMRKIDIGKNIVLILDPLTVD